MRTRDGRYIWIYERARLLRDRDGTPLWHGVIQDVSALKETQIGLARKVEQQTVLASLGRMATQDEDPDRLLKTAVKRIAELDRVIETSIWKLEQPDALTLVSRSGTIGKGSNLSFAPSEYPGKQLLKGEPVLIPDWDSGDPNLSIYRGFVPDAVASSFAAPIMGGRDWAGLILVHSGQRDAFTVEDSDFLLAAAGVLSNAIRRDHSVRSLRHRLDHDALTELPNRRFFEAHLSASLMAAEHQDTALGLIFIELDHFKLINDGIGHEAGNELLKSVAPRLAESVSDQGLVARLGGDEFGVILPSIRDASEATKIARRILAAISDPIAVEGAGRRITASAGISVRAPGQGDSQSPAEMIREADAAMYSAKEAGRARVRVFDDVMQEEMINRLKVEHDLHQAIERDELILHFQPIVEMEGERLTGFEALVRWNHPTEGLLTPAHFIPIAEESELIREIDTWVLREAISQANRWNRDRAPENEVGVSVNSSIRQLSRPDLVALVERLLTEQNLPPRLLTVELTESGLLSSSGHINATLDGLNRLGVRLSLDDFGTGFSSLSYLGRFPLDEIKIDRTFIDQLDQGDPRGSAIAEAVVRIGTALSMTVVAEAVPSKATLQRVREMGCHRTQGYLISPPLTADQADELVAASI